MIKVPIKLIFNYKPQSRNVTARKDQQIINLGDNATQFNQQQSGTSNTQNMTVIYGQPNNCHDEIEKAEKFLAPECVEQMISQIKDPRNQQQKTYYDKVVQDIVGSLTKKFAPIIKNHPKGDKFIVIRNTAIEAIKEFAYSNDKEKLKSVFANCLEQIREIKNKKSSLN